MKQMDTTNCKLCRSEAYAFPIGHLTLYECRNCGLISDNKVYDERELAELYDNLYNNNDSSDRNYNNHIRDYEILLAGRKVRLGWHRKEALHFIKEKGIREVFEFGAGVGVFGREVLRSGIAYSASEFDPATAERHNVINPGHCKVGDITKDLPDKKFELVCSFEVIEHINNLHQALVNIHDILTERGYLVFSVPNFKKFDNLKYGKIVDDRPPIHVNFFTKENIRMFHRYGFDTIEVKLRPYPAFSNLKRHLIPWLLGDFKGKGSTLFVVLQKSAKRSVPDR